MPSTECDNPRKPATSAKHIKISKKRSPTNDEDAAHVETSNPPEERQVIGQETKGALSNKAVPMTLATRDFPNQPLGNGGPPVTLENVAFLCSYYRVFVRYNVIKKQLIIRMDGHSGITDNAANSAITRVQSLAAKHGMSISFVPAVLSALGDENPYNPVSEWLLSDPWDGKDRLRAFYATITTEETFPVGFKETLMFKWALSAVAAALKPTGFRGRGVLTLQGPQGLGKTSWCRSLVPDSILCDEVIKLDHHLDGGKDSQIGAITHWIVEIGELDSSFRKDVARLKGFLTNDRDKVRRPYDKTEAEYQRRTVFLASVNQQDFLVDPTGNSRWWTLPCKAIDYDHGLDMQQVFAQLATSYEAGEQWWLTQGEEAELEYRNAAHRSHSVVVDQLEANLDLDPDSTTDPEAMTASEVLIAAGFDRPTNPQAKECAAFLREHVGGSKRIQGSQKWYVRLRTTFGSDHARRDEHEQPDRREFD